MTEIKKRQRKDFKKEILEFFETLETPVKPKLHINGAEHPNCVLTVDFGEPHNAQHVLEPPVLSLQEEDKLKDHMKNVTKQILAQPDANVRIFHDSQYGIWWATA